MLFNIILYCFATIGLINCIHYPIKNLSKQKQLKSTDPVNFINGVLFPDPSEDWKWIRVAQKDRFGERKDSVQFRFGNTLVVYDGLKISWDIFVLDTWSHNKASQVKVYWEAIRDAYVERHIILPETEQPKQITT